MKNILYGLMLLLLGMACNKDVKDSPKRNYVDVSGIDSTTKPGDNFFRYVNGKWYDTIPIADDQVGIGSYQFLNIPQKELLQTILEEASDTINPEGSIEQKVGDFYASGMDTATINQRGYKPIQPLLDRIEAIDGISNLMFFVADEVKSGNYSIIAGYIAPDDQNSSINMVHVVQTGLGLPDRDYYFKTDAPSVGIQNAYKNYIKTLFQLTGSSDEEASKRADKVYNIEKQFAESHKTRIEQRDVKANYHKLAVTDIEKNQPNIGWASLLNTLGFEADSIDVAQPAYYDTLNTMLVSVPINDWKTYIKANVMANYANILSEPFETAAFDYIKVIQGQSKQKTRAQRMVDRVDGQLGFALGQLYVKRYFNEDAKKRALELVNNLQKSLENRINNLDWMSDSTKVKAVEKLHAITKKIGYPDTWRVYNVTIDKHNFFENVVALRRDNFQYQSDKLNKAPDKTEWYTTPSTVTAYYNPSQNEIVFPAGILQYPYFDLYADDAINYGGIGMVIGHELTHAFDDQGAQYDKDGNVKNWWTEADYTKFKANTQKVIDQYSTFTVLDSVPIKGTLTVGENTADIAGIAIAYDAFKMTPQGQDTVKIDGLTPDQRFMYSIARIWRVKTRDEFLRNYVNTNPHSPAMWRVNGPLMNFTPFYEAFNVQPGDKNYRTEDERIKVW